MAMGPTKRANRTRKEGSKMKRSEAKQVLRSGKAHLRLQMLCALALALTVGCLGMSACQPQTQTTASSQGATEEAALAETGAADEPGTFTNPDAGAWSDTQYATAVNAGNRGCNACHADLFTVLPHGNNSKGLHEVDKEAAYGRVYTYNDCITCHVHSGETAGANMGGQGPYMAPSIHGSHLGNAEFNAKGGNCFSCHETDVPTGELGMWDILKYTKFIGLGSGTPTELNQTWLGGRGYETGTVTGGVAVHDVKLDNVTVNQDPTESSADLYSATNMDYPDLTDENFTVDIKGVVNEKTYTMDDLRALPQTEITYTRVCMTNGSNGGWFIANIPTKGVLISDIIKDCGGLVEGANAFATVGYDGWQGFMTPQPNTAALAGMDPNAMIAIEQFGEPIDLMDGGPAYFILPGDGASAATKWIKEISFSAVNGIAPMNYTGMMQTSWAGWLNPATDGQTFKVGEPVHLSGFAYVLPGQGFDKTSDVLISADYGDTWTSLGVPEGMDEDQWVRWEADWTPEVAGTYCLTVRAASESGAALENQGHVIVKVTE